MRRYSRPKIITTRIKVSLFYNLQRINDSADLLSGHSVYLAQTGDCGTFGCTCGCKTATC